MRNIHVAHNGHETHSSIDSLIALTLNQYSDLEFSPYLLSPLRMKAKVIGAIRGTARFSKYGLHPARMLLDVRCCVIDNIPH